MIFQTGAFLSVSQVWSNYRYASEPHLRQAPKTHTRSCQTKQTTKGQLYCHECRGAEIKVSCTWGWRQADIRDLDCTDMFHAPSIPFVRYNHREHASVGTGNDTGDHCSAYQAPATHPHRTNEVRHAGVVTTCDVCAGYLGGVRARPKAGMTPTESEIPIAGLPCHCSGIALYFWIWSRCAVSLTGKIFIAGTVH